ncbi:MAG: restriction endonuclease subunit S [Sterolibacterium sp.]
MSEWQSVRIGDVADVFDGPHATPTKVDSGPIFLGISSLDNGRLNLSESERVSEEDFVQWTRRVQPTAGDVVFSYETRLGQAALIPPTLRCCLGRRMGLVRPVADKLDPRFFLYQYLSPNYQEFLQSRTVHGSTVDRIPLKDFPDFPITLPGLGEQRAIAHILGTLDDKIELNRRMNETLEAMARAIFKSWFVDFDPVRAKASGESPESICLRLGLTPDLLALFPDSFQDSELGEIPKGWLVRSVEELCDRVAMGPFGSNIKTSNFVPTGVPIIRGGNLTDGFVDDRFVFLTEEKADQLRNSNARPGNIVITHRGTLGQVGLIPSDSRYPRYVVSQSQMVLSARSKIVSGRYLYEFLRSPIGQQALLANTSQVGVPAIAQPTTSVKAIRVAAPPVAVLRTYDLATKSLFDHASSVEKQSATLAKIRDELLPRLLSGQIATAKPHTQVEAA